MNTRYLTFILILCLSRVEAPAAEDAQQQWAALGDFRLESGEVIRDLRIGYRTLGQMNGTRSNAILFPTWFTGTTQDLLGLVGPEKLVNPSKCIVILVDAIGDSVSSSPSNSAAQPRMRFPKFTIRDMVRSQHELLTQVLKISHLRAVMGISMGGMQTFQWLLSYPDFMDKAIPIVGSPQLTSYDLLLWQSELDAIEADPAWNHGDYGSPPAVGMKTVAHIHDMNVTTPQYRANHTNRKEFPLYLQTIEQRSATGFDANNWIRQLQAMMGHDVSAQFDGSMEQAVAAVRAQVLVVVGLQDHMVNPLPALDFARLLVAPTLALNSDCGHLVTGCEEDKIRVAIARFLER